MGKTINLEPGKCYCLTSDNSTICFKVKYRDSFGTIIVELLYNKKEISFWELTKGGLSEDYDFSEIECPDK